jgi:hypothetical protein
MGTFGETTIVNYCLSFTDQKKFRFPFHLQQTNGSLLFLGFFPFAANKRKLLFSVSSSAPLTIMLRYIYVLTRNASRLFKKVIASVSYRFGNIGIIITFNTYRFNHRRVRYRFG